ncbi:MAG: protein kinase, partial [Muribaculaceae bacterium]|nr:protein kinase [Muribaculaceae bacterium]
MEYPLISEYREAILSAEDNFNELSSLRPVLDSYGNPVMSSGNFAVVFKMRDGNDGKLYAVKCFIKDQEGRYESYKKIGDELETVSSSYILPLRYLEKELFVDSAQCECEEFPVVVMEWVEGETLDGYLKRHINDKYELEMLSYRFNRMAAWLLPQPFAHGDLKPDNILVCKNGSLVLVDYDGMFVPSMKGEKAREIGSPDYRHPLRTGIDFDEHIDDFSIAVIALSLKAIAVNPEIKKNVISSDALLFGESDFRDVATSSLFKE